MKRTILFLWTFILLAVSLLSTALPLQAAIPQKERAALIAFYNKIENPALLDFSWKKPPLHEDGFSLPGTEGNWHSVTVRDNHVQMIYLDEYDWLSGTLAGELADLDYLEILVISENTFEGNIPPEFGNFKRLEVLNLYFNNFTGDIPPELGNITTLKALNLGANRLSGEIPPTLFSQMTQLESIFLETNKLTGPIPARWKHLSGLRALDLGYNKLTGTIPPEIGANKELVYLALGRNHLEGTIPKEIFNATKLERLELHENKLSGAIPGNIGNLTELGFFLCFGNMLRGEIPPSIVNTNLVQLHTFYLYKNALYCTDPTALPFVRNASLHSLSFQTLAPTEVAATPSSGSTVELSWKNIVYQSGDGGYRVHVGTKSGGPYQYVGMTPDKSTSSYLVAGLNPGQTYYFVVSTQTEPVFENQNTVESDYSEEVSAKAGSGSGGQYYSLSVKSSPKPDFNITASPKDANGNDGGVTDFALVYEEGTEVTLTAPNKANGQTFVRWNVNGTSDTNQTVTVTMNSDQTATAVYEGGDDVRTLSVQSSPIAIAGISVSPKDKNGNTDGTTKFTRYYDDGTSVTVTAPSTYSGYNFVTWTVDGTNNASRTVTVTMDANHSLVAYYSTKPAVTYSLNVKSTPATGAYIGVSKLDENLQSGGNTDFSRKYGEGTAVSLTAPAIHQAKLFSHWTVNGNALSNRTVTITMNSNRTVTAVYDKDAAKYTLKVQSSPVTGVTISALADIDGKGSGETNFTRTYYEQSTAVLGAPAKFDDKAFSYWKIDGAINKDRNISIAMDANHKAVAYYEELPPAQLSLNRSRVNFGCMERTRPTGSEELRVNIHGRQDVCWNLETSGEEWLTVGPVSGCGSGNVSISVDASGLSAGTYRSTLTVSAADAVNGPQTATVTLNIYSGGTKQPIGQMATPTEDKTYSGSIAVTGWVVDDMGVEYVNIFGKIGNGASFFIGKALFVEGARPDIEDAYPDYPGSSRAGWGYMLLTHFLPNGGNGEITLMAYAKDTEGHKVLLGSKRITCDNANSTLPFGAIDTPAQGGTASSSSYANHGWVLTPMPNHIPSGGSAIGVYVDSIKQGSATYGIARPDIADLLPGYAGSEAAGAVFTLDTTAFDEGVHSIFWIATDNAGNSAGIGSRFFTVEGSGSTTGLSHPTPPALSGARAGTAATFHHGLAALSPRAISREALPAQTAVAMTTGFGPLASAPEPGLYYPDADGTITLEANPMTPLALELFPGETTSGQTGAPAYCTGFMRVNGDFRALPAGSALDRTTGTFQWIPGPGFVGTYRLMFAYQAPDGQMLRKSILLNIIP